MVAKKSVKNSRRAPAPKASVQKKRAAVRIVVLPDGNCCVLRGDDPLPSDAVCSEEFVAHGGICDADLLALVQIGGKLTVRHQEWLAQKK